MCNNDILTLKKNSVMQSRSEVLAFEQALSNLAANPDISLLSDLFSVFNDECKQHEVMWGLIHFIETFDHYKVVQTLVSVTPLLEHQAQEWLEILYVRVVNGIKTRTYLKDILSNLTDEQKPPIDRFLARVASRSPKLKNNVDLVMS